MNKLKPRILLAAVLCLAGIFVALGGAGLYSAPSKARAEAVPGSAAPTANAPGAPDVVRLVGPVVSNTKAARPALHPTSSTDSGGTAHALSTLWKASKIAELWFPPVSIAVRENLSSGAQHATPAADI